MVVLEGGSMLNSNGNQYLQPDYLSPLPTTLDSKKSPLALLAQTCSQIGADNSNSKSLLSTLDKPKKTTSNEINIHSSPKVEKRSSPNDKLAFKPYEANVLTTKKSTEESRPSPKINLDCDDKKNESRSSSTKSHESPDKSEDKVSTPSSETSPIIRSGIEIMQGKDSYKTSLASSLCCPPGLETTNPAFRPPFIGSSYLLAGYPQTTPFLSYARVKNPAGGESLVPVCKDPYCTGCQLSSMHNPLNTGVCPSGCTQCDHQKYNLAMAMSTLGSPYMGSPYICNWISADNYCGKRFRTSEELLQHLRTHTNSESPSLLNPLANFHRLGYPPLSAPLSPLSARYHPYAKPTTLTPGFSAFNPALNPYYSSYLYGQRLGATVHP